MGRDGASDLHPEHGGRVPTVSTGEDHGTS